MRVVRTFHPVGQGAFYSERFYEENGLEFTMVYDCGSEDSNRWELHEKIYDFRQELKGRAIDLLFISHFHSDHVNGLKELLQDIRVRKTVVPMLTDDVITLTSIQNSLKDDRDALFANDVLDSIYYGGQLREFFGDIIAVSPEQNNPEVRSEDYNGLEWYPKGGAVINNGDKMQEVIDIWKYIPFNSISIDDARAKNFIDALRKEKDFLDSTGQPMCIEEIISTKRAALRDLYKRIIGGANDNIYTLCVESKPADGVIPEPCYRLSRCLYFGDFESKRKGVWARCMATYKDFPKIGTIQVPHHGSKNNWKEEMLESNGCRHYVISTGSRNRYHHPSYWVIREIDESGYEVSVVCEDKHSEVRFEFEV